jgi:hypothetical protein
MLLGVRFLIFSYLFKWKICEKNNLKAALKSQNAVFKQSPVVFLGKIFEKGKKTSNVNNLSEVQRQKALRNSSNRYSKKRNVFFEKSFRKSRTLNVSPFGLIIFP